MADQFKKFNDMEFFLDMQRCIGCHSCEMACAECETNGETSMIHIHYVDVKLYKPPYRCVCTAMTLSALMCVPPMLS